jgi:hypothetical protein
MPVPPPRSLRPEIDPGLEAVVLKCLQKDPGRRNETAGALAEDLNRWLKGELPPVVGTWAHLRAAVRRHPLRAAAVGLGVLLPVVLAAAFYLANPRKSDAPATAPEVDPSITLIGAGGLPAEYQWILGGQAVTRLAAAEGFSFTTTKDAAVQLLAAAPWESYSLEADVRHEGGQMGTAGVFFGYSGYVSGKRPCHFLCSAGIADRGAYNGQLVATLCRVVDNDPDHSPAAHCFRDLFTADPVRPGAVPPWRKLAVAVTPRGITVSCDGLTLCTRSAKEIGAQGSVLFKDVDVRELSWQSVPRGGIGIYLDKTGTASFRNVIIRPLKDGP